MLENSWNAVKCSEYSKMLECLKRFGRLEHAKNACLKMPGILNTLENFNEQFMKIYEKFNTQSKHKKIRKTTFRSRHRMFL